MRHILNVGHTARHWDMHYCLRSYGLTALAALALGMGLTLPGAPIANAQTTNAQTANTQTDAGSGDTQIALEKLETFANVFTIIRENYVEDVSDKTLIDKALNGALEQLDPHSHYVPNQDFEEQVKSARREYGGLGIEVVMENGLVKVNYANEGAPAARAGVKSGDYITAVAGNKVLGKTLDDAVEGMRGPAGEPITVTVLSAGQEPRDVTIVREVILGRAVRHRVEQGIGYIYIETFNHPRLSTDFIAAINALKGELGDTLPGLIIDMRGNRGGLLTETVKVASTFLDGGEVLSARGRKPEDTERYNAEAGELLAGTPIAALINSGSASAAEIVAGALQDRGRGLLVGRRSFGKGSVQSVIPLVNGGGALRLTTQRYFTPSGKSIQGRGILPDVLVAFRPDTGEIRERFREDSLPNAISNTDDDAEDYTEDHDAIDYPPEDWPETEDYQLRQAVTLVKSSRYERLLAAQNTPL